MSFTDDTAGQSPFRRPRFIIAAAVITVIAILGIVIGVVNATRDENPDPAPVPAPAAEAAAAPDGEDENTDSVCGLDGEVTGPARLTSAPPVDRWDYQGTTAYPVSAEYGPAAVDPAGFRYCYQHSPEGALLAAANAAVQGDDKAVANRWMEYFLSNRTPNRTELLSEAAAGAPSTIRMGIAGFRLLAYEGDSARVDLAIRVTSSGSTVYGSAIYDLVWEAGDWKLRPQDASNPLQLAEIPTPAGYITWGEQGG